jgi:hypothetical protein
MTINLKVHQVKDSPEARAAEQIRQALEDHVSKTNDSNLDQLSVHIIPSVQCFGSGVRDIDLVIIIRDLRDHPFEVDDRKIRTMCLTVELKDQSPDKVYFVGNECHVQYRDRDHNVTHQSERQKYAFRDYITQNLGQDDTPYIVNLIWFRNVLTRELPRTQHNIIGAELRWQQFLDQAVLSSRREGSGDFDVFKSREGPFRVSKLLTARLEPTEMDRRKIENVTKKVFKGEGRQWESKIGEQLLIFRGRGGTGKTVRLLRLAHQLYVDQGARVLLLTYNTALVADLKRLASLMGLSSSLADRAVDISSIHSFMGTWLRVLNVVQPGEAFIENYERSKNEAIEFLKGGAIARDDIKQAISKHSAELEWDYIMIDESQDWPENERDILYSLYDYKKFVIADGVDQLVRSQNTIDWRHQIDRDKSQIVTLRKSLRLKRNICDFVTRFCAALDYDWDVEPEPNSYGGRIIVVEGEQGLNESLHSEIFGRVCEEGNSLIDMLFCVPPSWVKRRPDGGGRSSTVNDTFKDWGYKPWDGVDNNIRKDFPKTADQLRIVQYDSCRGLEGWATFNYAIDKFFEYKLQTFVDPALQSDLLENAETRATLHAKRWMMIPLTRAIDTLVLHVESKDSYVGNILFSMRSDENIEWIGE